MKDTLRRFEVFPAFDRDGIAGRLEKMAERGWMIEKMGSFYWLYRRIEPRKLSFHVSFFPVGSPFCPSPTPGEEEFSDMCAHSGWTLAAKNGRMQVFYSADETAAPVETDPWVEAVTIHSVAMRTTVPMGGSIILCALYMLLGAAEELMGGAAMSGLSGLSTPFCAAISAIAVIYYAIELAAYFSWYIRAKRAGAAGERARYTRVGGALRVLQWSAFATSLAWSVCAGVFAVGPERLISLAFVLFPGVEGLTDRLRRAGVPQGLNRALTLCVSAACFAVPVLIGALA